MSDRDVVIVGAGHAGAQAAVALRQRGFTGSILCIGDEPELPYERPPLSKEYLSGDKPFERILIRPASFWEQRGITMRLGSAVTEVDADARRVRTSDGFEAEYGALIWATGGSPRRLTCDGHALVGVHGIRTRADVDRLLGELPDVQRAVVIGGGYIGLEAAAALVKKGIKVVLLEALNRVLARVAGETLSRFYEEEHRAHGVDVRLDTQVTCLEGVGKVTGVRLSDGEVLPADIVIVGIGIVPAVGPLLSAGAIGGNGVVVDALCRTTLPDVYAIGDCAFHPNPYAVDGAMRLESVQNANDQANVVAKHITGLSEPYDAVPWFWSNQYDLRLQTVGLSGGHDATVTRGDPANRSFSIVYLREGRVVALDCVNATKDYVQGKALVSARAAIAPTELADLARPLKEMLALAST